MFRNHCSPKYNHLLNSLPLEEYERIFPYLELVEMPLAKFFMNQARNCIMCISPWTASYRCCM